MNLSSGVTDMTPENHHTMVSGVFLFYPGLWAGRSNGNSICFDIRSYGFDSRPVHHEPTLASGTNQLRRCKPTEFGLVMFEKETPRQSRKPVRVSR